MRAFVAYSRPRGKYGRYVFTVMIYFSEPSEKADIQVSRNRVVYSCGHCGRWASINTHETLSHTEHQKNGLLELYRYDSVQPDDTITITFRDSELVVYQMTQIYISFDWKVYLNSYWRYPQYDGMRDSIDTLHFYSTEGKFLKDQRAYEYVREQEPLMTDEILYDVVLVNWDDYLKEQSGELGEVRIEEELISKTMKAEQITITDLLLEPVGQPLSIEGSKHFIEGELRYLS